MTFREPVTPLSVAARPELTGGRRIGVLLSHGFTSTPASMKPWANSLAERGYAVEVPLLPGHGTTWQEMNRTTFADWYGEIVRVFEKLSADNDAVVVGGLSMGGTLALRLAADRPERVAGVVAVNPAVKLNRFDVKLAPLLSRLLPSYPAIASDIKKEGVVEDAYERTPLKAVNNQFKAWKALIADLPRVTAPVLYLRSTVDHVVDEASEPVILGNISSRDVTVVRLENSYHVATIDNDAPTIFEQSAAFVARVTA
jgi:carboxylesterase